MKKIIIVSIALMLTLVNINGYNLKGASNGILYVGGNGEGNYTRIQEAINDAEDGYTIYVYPKQYNENIVVNKSISLIGIEENGKKPIIHAKENKSAVLIERDGCTLKGFTIMSQEISVSQENPPSCEVHSDNNIIENNTFMYGVYAFYLYNSSHNQIKNNEFTKGYTAGICTRKCSHNIISYNTARGNMGEGFLFCGETDSTITQNIATENCCGMEIYSYSHNCTISFNHIYANQQYGMGASLSSNISILNNKIHNHVYGGLVLADSSYCNVSGNEIYLNQVGVKLQGSGTRYASLNNVITKNNIYSNYVGIYWELYCGNNYFTYNNLDNSVNAFFWDEIHIFDPGFPFHIYLNILYKNYWSDWNFKIPKPIKGIFTICFPRDYYNVLWFNFDWHPALEPYGNFTTKNLEKLFPSKIPALKNVKIPIPKDYKGNKDGFMFLLRKLFTMQSH
ncbi:MAG: right-handed parallel beta-helix repeat-containing protein [Thermoplasmatales archaeon]|nr:right-handed parallel beta-helix repeat-containing protein [Thermoplasmatales archaeon]